MCNGFVKKSVINNLAVSIVISSFVFYQGRKHAFNKKYIRGLKDFKKFVYIFHNSLRFM